MRCPYNAAVPPDKLFDRGLSAEDEPYPSGRAKRVLRGCKRAIQVGELEVIIELGSSPDQSRQINHLPAGRSSGEGQPGDPG
jgi:hypothetical protein